jgi:ribosome-binding factor A
MKRRKPSRRQIAFSVSEVGPGDGVDPRYERESSQRPGKRKALQLCREAERTLSAVLAGECGDDLLRELIVRSVEPAPNAVRLLVTVSLPQTAGDTSVETVLERLHAVAARLRSEVAGAVRRRRAPELIFRVVSTH